MVLDAVGNVASRLTPRPATSGASGGGFGLPAAKHFDPVLGLDIHFELVPPVIPVVHPFIGFLFDPFDYIPFIGGTVFVNGIPRAQAGTAGLRMPPHQPLVGAFVKPPENECEMFMGSMTVAVDGDAFSYMALPALSCNDLGMPAPPRPKSPPVQALVLPTSTVIAIPMGPPVFVGGPPTISLMALGMRVGMALMGKGLSALARKASKTGPGGAIAKKAIAAGRRIEAAADRVMEALEPMTSKIRWADSKFGPGRAERAMGDALNPGLRRRTSSVNRGCGRVGEPIDVVTGATVDEFEDFVLPGASQQPWTRTYDSRHAKDPSPLGRGFRLWLQCELHEHEQGFTFVDTDGDVADFPPLPEDGRASVHDGLRLRRRPEPGTYVLESSDGVRHLRAFEPGGPALPTFWREGTAEWTIDTDPEGRPVRLRNGTGQRLELRYDDRGRLVEVVDGRDSASSQELARYVYDDLDLLVEHIDALGHSSRFAYDSAGRMTRKTNRLGYSFHYHYDEAGRCVHSHGDDGMVDVRLAYSSAERETVVTWADGPVWRYRWDEGGVLTSIVGPDGWAQRFVTADDGRVVQHLDPAGNVTTLLYDEFGGHHARRDPLGYHAPPIDLEPAPPDPLEYSLPASPLRWCHGRLAAAGWDETPPRPHRDALGQLYAEQDARGTERWQRDAEGNVLGHRDADGHITRFRYDSWNQLRERHDAGGGIAHYDSDLRGNITRFEDPGGTVHRFVHDACDRVVEVHRDEVLIERYRWDRGGHLRQKVDGHGQPLVDLEVGAGNLMTERRLSSGETQRFEYDARGRIRLAWTDDCCVERRCDDAGRVLVDRRDDIGVEHDWSAGKLRSTRFAGRFEVRYSYPQPGSVVIDDPLGGCHRIDTGPGRTLVRTFSNGTVESLRYDHHGALERSELTIPGHPMPSTWQRSFEYSAHGDLLRATDSHYGTTTYRHDALHRLKARCPPNASAEHWTWDAADNLIGRPGAPDLEIGQSNQLKRAAEETFAYDHRQRMSERRGGPRSTRYHYDALDRLIACEIDGASWVAAYDPLGRIISKTWAGETTRYYWDDFRLAAEHIPEGTLRVYVYSDLESLVPMMFIEVPSADSDSTCARAFFVFTDQLGTPVLVQDEQGRSVWRARVSPFGAAQIDPASIIALDLRMPGHLHDPALGLHHNRFRAYDPELGRYLQPDPLGLAGGLNLYTYCPDPLSTVDLDGHVAKCKTAKTSTGGSRSLGSNHNKPFRVSTREQRYAKWNKTNKQRLQREKLRRRRKAELKASGQENAFEDLWAQVRTHVQSNRGRRKMLRDWYYDGRAKDYASPEDLAVALDTAHLAKTGRQRPAFTQAIIDHYSNTHGGKRHRRHIVMSSAMRRSVYSVTDNWNGTPDELLQRYNALINRAGLKVDHRTPAAAEQELVRVLHNNPANLILDDGPWNSAIGSLANNARDVLRANPADFLQAFALCKSDPETYLGTLVHGFQPHIQRKVINEVWIPYAKANPPQDADEFRRMMELIYDNAAVDLMTRHTLTSQQIQFLKMHARFDTAELKGDMDLLEAVARDFIDVGNAYAPLPYPNIW